MVDRLKEIPAKILAWWKQFTSRQKSVIVGIAAAIIFAFVIIFVVLSRTEYSRLTTCESTADAAEIVEILDAAGIKHRESSDGLRIDVETSQLSAANLAIGSAGFVPDGFKYDDYMSSGLTSTSTDSARRYAEYLSDKFANTLTSSIDSVLSARVHIDLANNDGTLLAQTKESYVYIQLTTDGTINKAQAATIAKAAATFVGNATTSNITVADQNATTLFSGGDDNSAMGIASSTQELQNQVQSMVSNQVRNVFYATQQFDQVEVGVHMPVDYNTYEKTIKTYSAPEGRDEGLLARREDYYEESNSQGAGVPGTSSNDETVEVYPDNNDTHSMQSESIVDYLPNETIENILSNSGAIDYANASVSVALFRYRDIYESDLRAQGALDGVTWEQYQANNSGDVKLEVDEDLYAMVANAAGVNANRITIVAYESPVFHDREGLNISVTTVSSVFLFIVIIALLAFVVLRTMIPKRSGEEEEEISVEDLLQSTPDEAMEEFGEESKSEARKIIEKFVDENPESVAILLRNWLNEDWG
ncbi:MAG: flagellar M-ring protein FliF [Candidatus Gastranaerophilales bacterium]|nr:flagellar M-ring protein FliF [Candidatus Gastranaerophilales bacterium]